MSSEKLCCDGCLSSGIYREITNNNVGCPGIRVCVHHVHEYPWNGCCCITMISEEICAYCKKMGSHGPMVELDPLNTPEGKEIYICSHKCLKRWMAKKS